MSEKKERTVEEIDADIAKVKEELEGVKGSTCEVYARIVGYYRSVKGWNNGKAEEYKKRVLFKQENARTEEMCGCGNETAAGAHRKEAV